MVKFKLFRIILSHSTKKLNITDAFGNLNMSLKIVFPPYRTVSTSAHTSVNINALANSYLAYKIRLELSTKFILSGWLDAARYPLN